MAGPFAAIPLLGDSVSKAAIPLATHCGRSNWAASLAAGAASSALTEGVNHVSSQG